MSLQCFRRQMQSLRQEGKRGLEMFFMPGTFQTVDNLWKLRSPSLVPETRSAFAWKQQSTESKAF